ncbi:MAG: precorrin-6y C5,15-methyltransferase (decarboxylating) subunit CbiE [Nodosilinea sp.]
MTPIQVVGVGLDGRSGLPQRILDLIDGAQLLVGSSRHLSYFADSGAERWNLEDLSGGLERLQQWLTQGSPGMAVVLTSGDPLFFGLGRLLLAHLPAASLTFHPQVSAIQLAFSRLKLPWQGATLISAHGRSTDLLIAALRRGDGLIAVLTDAIHSPASLGQLVISLGLAHSYRLWVCENLGDARECLYDLTPLSVQQHTFAALNVVVLQRQSPTAAPNLPLLGLPDESFACFSDRPGLMTKRDIRIHILADLALQPDQILWDIGAGTGSVSIEINRLCPQSQVYAIEKTLAGITLIEQNRQNLGNPNLYPIHGVAPQVLQTLPDPHRIFIGGSGGNLTAILDACSQRLRPQGHIVLALATLEHLHSLLTWVKQTSTNQPQPWQVQLRQIQINHSTQVAHLHRWQPLSPITLATLSPP